MVMADSTDIAFTKVRMAHGWLGNMAPFPIQADGRLWRTSEALFHARRFTDAEAIDAIHGATSPMQAKLIAKAHASKMVIEPRSAADVDNMRSVLRLKIDQHPQLKAMLLDTHGRIIEDCSARPTAIFWGARRTSDGWEGQNMLGVLWMELRDQLRHELSDRTADLFASTRMAPPRSTELVCRKCSTPSGRVTAVDMGAGRSWCHVCGEELVS